MTRAIVKLTTRWLLALLATTWVCGAQGAEADSPAEDTTPPAESSASAEPDKTSDKKKTRDGKSPEVFIPSEEISEDFAVSFPVDI